MVLPVDACPSPHITPLFYLEMCGECGSGGADVWRGEGTCIHLQHPCEKLKGIVVGG